MIYECPTWAFIRLHRIGFFTRTLTCHHWNVGYALRTEKKCYSLIQGPFSLNRHSLLLLTFLLLRPAKSLRIQDQSSQNTFRFFGLWKGWNHKEFQWHLTFSLENNWLLFFGVFYPKLPSQFPTPFLSPLHSG